MEGCVYCSFQSNNKLCVVKHLFEAHNFESNFCYACEITPCQRIFVTGDSFNAFRSHCTRYHLNWKDTLNSMPNEDEYTLDDDGDLTVNAIEMNNHVCDSVTEMDTRQSTELEEASSDYNNEASIDNRHSDVETTVAHFILNLKEKFKLTQASLNFAIKSVEELVMVSANNVKQSIKNEVGDTAIINIPDHCFVPESPFLNLKSEYQQTKFFKENFNLVVSLATQQ